MLTKLWSVFQKALWPLLWPIIRDNMVEVVQDLAAWLRKAIADRFSANAEAQHQRAESRARDAEQHAVHAVTDEDRIRAKAKAEAWREIAEQLRKDNEHLKQQLDEAIRASQVYARKRIDSEAERDKLKRDVQSLKPPSDAGWLPSIATE